MQGKGKCHQKQPSIEISILPSYTSSNPPPPDLLAAYKAFRLHSLKTAPNAFAMTYDEELLFPDERWIQRLSNPAAVQFVAVESAASESGSAGCAGEEENDEHDQADPDPDGDGDGGYSSSEKAFWQCMPWLGSLVLVRCSSLRNDFDGGKYVDRSSASASAAASEISGAISASEQQEVIAEYHMNAVFVDPTIQGRGLGKRLLQSGMAFVKQEAAIQGATSVRLTTLVDSWNEVAIGLYAQAGFVKVGVDSYTVGREQREAVEMECRVLI